MDFSKDDYYSVASRKEIREESKKLRNKFLRYKEAEIVYSIQHKNYLNLQMMQVRYIGLMDMY